MTLRSDGHPLVWEPLADSSGLRLLYVSESLEAAARTTLGEPLPGRAFATAPPWRPIHSPTTASPTSRSSTTAALSGEEGGRPGSQQRPRRRQEHLRRRSASRRLLVTLPCCSTPRQRCREPKDRRLARACQIAVAHHPVATRPRGVGVTTPRRRRSGSSIGAEGLRGEAQEGGEARGAQGAVAGLEVGEGSAMVRPEAAGVDAGGVEGLFGTRGVQRLARACQVRRHVAGAGEQGLRAPWRPE
jgi:hypothetical protein